MLTTSARVGVRPTLPSRRAAVVVKAQGEREGPLSRFAAGTVATLTAAALMTSAMVPEEALAAKSSGRVGGSSGFKSRRVESAPARSTSTTTVNNVVVGAPMVAPPVFGGFGYGSPFGFSIMPTFVMPFPFFGGLLQFFFLITVVSLIFNVVRTLGAGANKSNNKGDKDGWGDL